MSPGLLGVLVLALLPPSAAGAQRGPRLSGIYLDRGELARARRSPRGGLHDLPVTRDLDMLSRPVVDMVSRMGRMPPLECGSCAVVASSGSLLEGLAGKEIDAHDCVFRMNLLYGIKDGYYTAYVGAKTTVHLWSMPTMPEGFGDLTSLRERQQKMMEHAALASNVSVCVGSGQESAKVVLRALKDGKLRGERVRTVHPRLIQELCEESGLGCGPNRRPSTGLIATQLALRLCARPPRLYGFNAHSIPVHYYDPPDHVCDAWRSGRVSEGSRVHSWVGEQQHLLRWHSAGQVELMLTKFSQPTMVLNASECQLPDKLTIVSRHWEMAGVYQVQPYTLNGKVAFERADPLGRGDTDRMRFLYYTACNPNEIVPGLDLRGPRIGVWIISKRHVVEESQRVTPGMVTICTGFTFSVDFRPESPEGGTWWLPLGDDEGKVNWQRATGALGLRVVRKDRQVSVPRAERPRPRRPRA